MLVIRIEKYGWQLGPTLQTTPTPSSPDTAHWTAGSGRLEPEFIIIFTINNSTPYNSQLLKMVARSDSGLGESGCAMWIIKHSFPCKVEWSERNSYLRVKLQDSCRTHLLGNSRYKVGCWPSLFWWWPERGALCSPSVLPGSRFSLGPGYADASFVHDTRRGREEGVWPGPGDGDTQHNNQENA